MANTRKTGSAARCTVRLSARNLETLGDLETLEGLRAEGLKQDRSTVLRAGLEALRILGGLDRTGTQLLRAAFVAVAQDEESARR